MSAKVTRVSLSNDALNIKEMFEITHAERLLGMQNNGGWRLSDSKYKIGKDGITRVNDKADSRKNTKEVEE